MAVRNSGFRVDAFPYRKWSGTVTVGYELGVDKQTIDQTEIVDTDVYQDGNVIRY